MPQSMQKARVASWVAFERLALAWRRSWLVARATPIDGRLSISLLRSDAPPSRDAGAHLKTNPTS
eukprot:6062377-Prymnesium_polylepis.2